MFLLEISVKSSIAAASVCNTDAVGVVLGMHRLQALAAQTVTQPMPADILGRAKKSLT